MNANNLLCVDILFLGNNNKLILFIIIQYLKMFINVYSFKKSELRAMHLKKTTYLVYSLCWKCIIFL